MTRPSLILRAAFALVLGVSALSAARVDAQAAAEPSTEARAEASQRFRRGVELYAEGDYAAALIEFRRANEAVPTFSVLYNIGQTHLALREYVASLRAFERYLEQGGERVPAARRTEVESQIVNLRARTALLMVIVNVDGASIRVDDEVVAQSPMSAPIAVDIGRHRIEVRADEHETDTRTVEIAGGDTSEVRVDLVENPYFVASSAEAEAPARPLRTLAIVGFVLTGSLIAASTATGVLAMQSRNDFNDELARRPGDADAIDAARDQTRSRALVTDILLGTTLAVGGASLTFLLLDGKQHREEPTDASVGLSIGVGRIGAYGRF